MGLVIVTQRRMFDCRWAYDTPRLAALTSRQSQVANTPSPEQKVIIYSDQKTIMPLSV
ncbi:hypothetical protein DPMN_033179 [Dreissena polymorpha]|uniref:Uncharacterized protein n=1 Tax=Dreissena polymorpha TaxID=45954 RepID=A0A9D4RIM7_DREPO|nr:hypothetical protein DPMN_033179 [Dreissena polymorpha]